MCVSRREAHDEFWFLAGDQNGTSSEEDEEQNLIMGGIRAACSPLYQDIVEAPVGAMPGLGFSFEQNSMWREMGTGCVQWYWDRDVEFAVRGAALVLGCGLEGMEAETEVHRHCLHAQSYPT